MTEPICPTHRCPIHDCFRIHYPQAFRYPPDYDPDLGDGAALKAAYEFMQARATKPRPEEGSTLQRYDGCPTQEEAT